MSHSISSLYSPEPSHFIICDRFLLGNVLPAAPPPVLYVGTESQTYHKCPHTDSFCKGSEGSDQFSYFQPINGSTGSNSGTDGTAQSYLDTFHNCGCITGN